jgi:hypothetical protein
MHLCVYASMRECWKPHVYICSPWHANVCCLHFFLPALACSLCGLCGSRLAFPHMQRWPGQLPMCAKPYLSANNDSFRHFLQALNYSFSQIANCLIFFVLCFPTLQAVSPFSFWLHAISATAAMSAFSHLALLHACSGCTMI